ncbi:ATP-binding protein [Streptodolium elevatio]
MSDEQRAHVRALAAPVADTSRGRNPASGTAAVVQPGSYAPAAAAPGPCGTPYARGDHKRAAPELPASAETTYRFAYEPTPECVRHARREVDAVCDEHGIDSFGPVLVASELVTNALPFAERFGVPVVLTMYVNPSVLLVEVADPATADVPALDEVRRPSDAATNGRGLLLAKEISDGLEVVVSGHSKAICARFERDSAT